MFTGVKTKWLPILTAAGLLVAAVMIIPVAEMQNEDSRRPRGAGAVMAAVRGEGKGGEERIAGSWSRVERTVIRLSATGGRMPEAEADAAETGSLRVTVPR